MDATNILNVSAAILSPIALDHEAVLGNRIEDIAREKAAIVCRNADVVVSPQPRGAMRSIQKRIKSKKARFWPAQPVTNLPITLLGDFQKVNAGAAVEMAKILKRQYGFFEINEDAIRAGLKSNHWPGRFEIFRGSPSFLLDGAHNPTSVEALVRNLKRIYPKKKRLLIFGVSREKKSELMLKLLGQYFSEAIIVPIPNPRSQEINKLLLQGRRYFCQLYPTGEIYSALELALKKASGDSLVVATGSFYLIGEIRKWIKKLK